MYVLINDQQLGFVNQNSYVFDNKGNLGCFFGVSWNNITFTYSVHGCI